MRCVGCMDAPEYQPGDSDAVFYCNRDCQKGHWPTHKAHCRILGRRRKLLRAAETLKSALLTYREVAYDVDLTKIELRDGVLLLHQNQRSAAARSKRGLFPDHLITNKDHKKAALVNIQCTTAMALLGPLTRKLLKGERLPRIMFETRLTFSRSSFDYRTSGSPYRKATDPNPARPGSRVTQCAAHSVKSGTTFFQ